MFEIPSGTALNKAGDILRSENASEFDKSEAFRVLSLWRGLHITPLKYFHTTIKSQINKNNFETALIAQRLKRLPSIISKLKRFDTMRLSAMQDIGGMRVIVDSVSDVYKLYSSLCDSNIKHKMLLPPTDYIKNPKSDGYRSLHQVFKYISNKQPELKNLRIELQIRSKLQHAWATAVETLGIIENASFKTGAGDEQLKEFFRLASALFSMEENMPIMDKYKNFSKQDLKSLLNGLDDKLNIRFKLKSIIGCIKQITNGRSKGYHLLELNSEKNYLALTPIKIDKLQEAEEWYLDKERETQNDDEVSLVLLSAGNVKEIQTAYPNYYLDAKAFLDKLDGI